MAHRCALQIARLRAGARHGEHPCSTCPAGHACLHPAVEIWPSAAADLRAPWPHRHRRPRRIPFLAHAPSCASPLLGRCRELPTTSIFHGEPSLFKTLLFSTPFPPTEKVAAHLATLVKVGFNKKTFEPLLAAIKDKYYEKFRSKNSSDKGAAGSSS